MLLGHPGQGTQRVWDRPAVGMSTPGFEDATEDGPRSIGVVTGVGSGASVWKKKPQTQTMSGLGNWQSCNCSGPRTKVSCSVGRCGTFLETVQLVIVSGGFGHVDDMPTSFLLWNH